MRTLTNLAAIAIVVFTMVFTSCSPDPVAPSISVTPDATENITPGQTVVFDITVSADTEAESSLSKFTISEKGMLVDADAKFATAGEGTFFSFVDGETNASFQFEYMVPTDATVGDLTLEFTVQDSETLMMTNTQTITVSVSKPNITVTKTSDVPSIEGASIVYSVELSSTEEALKDIAVVVTNVEGLIIEGAAGTGVDNTDGLFVTDTETFVANTNTATFNYTFVIPANVTASDLTLNFTVANTFASEMAVETITVEALSVLSSKVLSYNSLDLSALSQLSLTTGEPVSSATVNASPNDNLSDFALCTYTSTGASLVSPDAVWLTQLYAANNSQVYSSNTATKLERVTTDFATIDAAYLEALTVNNTALEGVDQGFGITTLVNGDVIVFETSAGKKGALKVSIAKTTETITIDVRIQE